MKILKKLVIIVGISLITILVFGVLLYRFYFASRVEGYLLDRLQSTLEQQFKREVSLGSLRLNFPNPQITISDIAIAREQKLSDGTLLAAKTLKAKILLRSLFSKQILIDDIVLDTPTVWIAFDEQGRSNLPSFEGQKEEESPKKDSKFNLQKLVECLYFPRIQLIDGDIYFAHKKIPLTVSVQRLNTTLSLALKDFRAQGNISLQEGEVEFQNREKMAVAMSGDLKFENRLLSLSSFHLQVNNSEVTIDGTLANLTKPDLNLSVKTHLVLEELDKFFRINQNLAGMVAFEGTVAGPIPDVIVTGQLTCREGSAWKLDFENVSTNVTYQKKQVIATNLEVNIFDGSVSGNGQVSFLETPRYQASLAVENLNIEQTNRIVAPQHLPLEGRVSGNVEVKGDGFGFEDLIVHSFLSFLEVDAYGVKVSQGNAQVDIQDQILYVNDLQAAVFQGMVTGNGNMGLSPTPNYQVTLDVQQVSLDPIMALIPEQPDVSGQVSGKISASGAKFDLASVVVETDLEAVNVDAYSVKAKILNISGHIKNSILSLSKFSTQLFEGNVSGQGKLVLSGDTLPQFDVQASLQDISVQSVLRQFALNVRNTGPAFEGKISGDVTLSGNSYTLKDITGTATLKGKAEVDNQSGGVPLELLLQCSLQENVVDIASFNMDSSTLKLTTSGTVNLMSPELKLRYDVASKDIHTLMKQILMFIPGIEDDSPLQKFSGNIEQLRGTIQGPVTQLQIQADAHFTETDFVWIKADDMTAEIIYQEKMLRINHFRAVRKSAYIEATGSIDLSNLATPRLELPISLKSGKLSDYLAMLKQEYPLEGTVKAVQTAIRGSVDDLQGKITLNISDGTAWEQSFDMLSGNLELAHNRVIFNSLTVKKNGGNINLEGFVGFDLVFRAALTATDISFRDVDAFKNIALQYQGLTDISLEAEGTLQDPRGKAAIRFKNLVYSGKQIEDITCDVVMEKQTVQATLTTFHKKFIASFQLSLTSELLYRAELVMEHAVIEQILSFAVDIKGISGLISGRITSEGSLQDLQKLSATIKLSELQLDIFGQQVENSKEIDVMVTPQKITVNSLELKGKELGLFAQGFLDFQGRFDLALDGIIDLRPVLPFLPKTAGITSLAGHVQLICNMRGTFANPEIEGIAEINNGSIQLEAYPDPAIDIHGRLAFTKKGIEIIRLEGNVSKGSFVSYGIFNYHGLTPDTFSIDVEGKNIIVQNIVEALTLTVSPHIRISGDFNRQELVGEVLVHNALYTKDLDLQTMVFEKNRKKIVLPTIETGQEQGQIELDLLVTAPKNIVIRNKLAELDLRANLHIQGTVEEPQLEGRVEVLKGTILFGNRKYRILSGVLDFTDPSRLNPEMNIQVETVVQEYKISLGIEGNLDQFTLDMRSEPELSKGQITRLLATGSGAGTNGYGLVTKPIQTFVEGQIEKAVKLDQFTVDVDPLLANSNGEEATPRVTLGKRLFKDLLLTFTTTVGGSERAQIVEIEYQLSDKLSLTAKRNEDGEIDTSFTFRFKIK